MSAMSSRGAKTVRHGALKSIGRSIMLEEASIPQLMRYTIYVISGMVACFSVWSAVTEIGEVTRAEGEVIPSNYVQVVQHLEGGIVSAILVQEGEVVDKGQPLLRLQGVGVEEDFAKHQIALNSLKQDAESLRAFMDGRNPDFLSITTSKNEANDQERFYKAKLDAKQKEAEVLRSQSGQKREAVRSLQTRRDTIIQNLKLSEETLGALKTLLDKGLANRFRYLEQQESTNQLRGQLAEINTEISSAQQGYAEYQQRSAALAAGYHDQAAQDLNKIESQIRQEEESLSKIKERVDRLEVRSPSRGIVKSLEIHTVGGIVGAGEKILEIVPLDDQIVVEAKISTSDVGHLKVGQPVQIKVHSYDFVRYGMVPGTLESISPTTFIDKTNKTYYRARVLLQQPYVGRNPHNNAILPGMTVEADISTGSKTVLSYLMKPIHAATSSALQER